MKIFKILPALASLPLLLAASLASASTPTAAPAMTDRSCHLPGVVEALRCVTVTVPLDHAKPQAGALKLHVTVAPAFRQATLWGVVLGAVAAVVVVTFSILWERRSRELRLLRAQVDQLQKDLPPALPLPKDPPPA